MLSDLTSEKRAKNNKRLNEYEKERSNAKVKKKKNVEYYEKLVKKSGDDEEIKIATPESLSKEMLENHLSLSISETPLVSNKKGISTGVRSKQQQKQQKQSLVDLSCSKMTTTLDCSSSFYELKEELEKLNESTMIHHEELTEEEERTLSSTLTLILNSDENDKKNVLNDSSSSPDDDVVLQSLSDGSFTVMVSRQEHRVAYDGSNEQDDASSTLSQLTTLSAKSKLQTVLKESYFSLQQYHQQQQDEEYELQHIRAFVETSHRLASLVEETSFRMMELAQRWTSKSFSPQKQQQSEKSHVTMPQLQSATSCATPTTITTALSSSISSMSHLSPPRLTQTNNNDDVADDCAEQALQQSIQIDEFEHVIQQMQQSIQELDDHASNHNNNKKKNNKRNDQDVQSMISTSSSSTRNSPRINRVADNNQDEITSLVSFSSQRHENTSPLISPSSSSSTRSSPRNALPNNADTNINRVTDSQQDETTSLVSFSSQNDARHENTAPLISSSSSTGPRNEPTALSNDGDTNITPVSDNNQDETTSLVSFSSRKDAHHEITAPSPIAENNNASYHDGHANDADDKQQENVDSTQQPSFGGTEQDKTNSSLEQVISTQSCNIADEATSTGQQQEKQEIMIPLMQSCSGAELSTETDDSSLELHEETNYQIKQQLSSTTKTTTTMRIVSLFKRARFWYREDYSVQNTRRRNVIARRIKRAMYVIVALVLLVAAAAAIVTAFMERIKHSWQQELQEQAKDAWGRVFTMMQQQQHQQEQCHAIL